MRRLDEVWLFTDGASRGNPGPAAIGVVVTTPAGEPVESFGEAIGVATNNVAEYTALLRGLARARDLGARRVRVHSDSELLVRQLRGEYAVRHPGLQPLHAAARRLLAGFAAAEVRHVPRERNREADRLANAALDAARAPAGAAPPPAPAAPRLLRVLQVDAFTSLPLAGNPAGVVPDAAGLDADEMQAVARELNVSETAFVLPPEAGGDLRLRYFTPVCEVPLCGHATVAAVHALAAEGRLGVPGEGAARLRLETGAGLLPVEVFRVDGRPQVWFATPGPRWRAFAGAGEEAELAACLGLPADAIGLALSPPEGAQRLAPVLAGFGLWHLLVPVRDPAAVRAARPDRERLGRLNERLGVHTTYLFTRAAGDAAAAPAAGPGHAPAVPARPGHAPAAGPGPAPAEACPADLHARCFAPVLGIAEDPQTGTAAGTLGAFLAAAGVARRAGPLGRPGVRPGAVRLVLAQGEEVGRPGRILVEAVPGAGRRGNPGAGPGEGGKGGEGGEGLLPLRPVAAVWVGGEAVVSLDGWLRLPPPAARPGVAHG